MDSQVRQIVRIDEELCDGCGDCLPHCAEGALEIVNGKARLAADKLCDGLGACLGVCPKGAIEIIEREANEFSEEAVQAKMALESKSKLNVLPQSPVPKTSQSCPGSQARSFTPESVVESSDGPASQSALSHWPVQLRLLPAQAPVLDNAVLLLAADCVPVACADFHSKLLAGKAVVLACPKFDDQGTSFEHLASIVQQSNIKEIVVAHMEVPCCTGLIRLAVEACKAAGKDVPITTVEVGIQGALMPETSL